MKIGLWDEDGKWCETTKGIANTTISYFEKLHTTSLPTRIAELTSIIRTKVTAEMNQILIRNFTMEEIKAALHQMHPHQSP